MQEMRPESSKQLLTVEQLIQLKQLEKPGSKFWDRFDHELKQKQLQALMRPSRWQRLRAACTRPHLSSLAPLGAASVLLIALGWIGFSTFVSFGSHHAYALAEGQPTIHAAMLTAEKVDASSISVETEAPLVTEVPLEAETASPQLADSRFVEVVLRPETAEGSQATFITVADTETFTGSADRKAYYVVNAFTVRPVGYGDRAATFEF